MKKTNTKDTLKKLVNPELYAKEQAEKQAEKARKDQAKNKKPGRLSKNKKPSKRTKGIETYCPAFPGFYGTIFEGRDDEEGQELDNMFEQLGVTGRQAEKLSELAARSGSLYSVDYSAYYLEYAQRIMQTISDKLKDFEPLQGFEGLEFQQLRSPKEYNFQNDSINIKVLYKNKKTFLLSLLGIIQTNRPAFDEHIKKHYTSRSGFISHYSNAPEDWINDIFQALKPARTMQLNCYVKETKQGPEVLAGHKLGRLLDFVCEVAEIEDLTIYEGAEAPYIGEYMSGPLCELCNGSNPTLPDYVQEILNAIDQGREQLRLYAQAMQARPDCIESQAKGLATSEAALYGQALELLINGPDQGTGGQTQD